MIKRLFNWIKSNKLTFLLLVVVAYLISKSLGQVTPVFERSASVNTMYTGFGGGMMNSVGSAGIAPKMMTDSYMPTTIQDTPRPEITNRKMVTTSYFSLMVKDVTGTLNNIKGKIAELKGYVVNVNVDRPELGENASIEFRVPSDQVDNVTAFLRSQAIKVVSENVSGTDITDQYTDIKEYLDILTKNKARLEDILTSAKTVNDILLVQNQIFSVQAQIDSYKGQLAYLDGTSSTSLITAYISTDETGLPYSQPLSWRPEVIFKHAVRSLIGTLQGAGSALIWLGVYSVLIVPALTIVLIVVLITKKKKQQQ